MKMTGTQVRRGLVALLLFAVTASAQSPSKIVAIGDVHGAYPEFVSILQRTGLIDGSLNWSGKDVTFVQLGDILDRGAESKKALDLMMKLEGQAAQKQCKVIPLLGNHEVMDMSGDVRYVSAGEYQAFSTDQSEARRQKEFENYKKFMSTHVLAGSAFSNVDRDTWMAEHPPGFFELRDAYGPKGEYGKWFRSHDVVAEVGGAVFLHGGLDPELHYKNVQEINKKAHEELSEFDFLWKSLAAQGTLWPYMTYEEASKFLFAEYNATKSGSLALSPSTLQDIVHFLRDVPNWSINNPNGPLWYRDLALRPEDASFEGKLGAMLKNLRAEHIVMGHTVMVKNFSVTPRFDDLAFLIDTGMNAAYFHGRPSALEIEGGRYTALYADGQQQVLLNPSAGQGVHAQSQAADGKLAQ